MARSVSQQRFSILIVAASFLLTLGCVQQNLQPLAGAPDADAELLTAGENADSPVQRSSGSLLEMLATPDRVIIVDFWGPHCPPCRQLAPELEKVVQQNPDSVSVVKVDVESSANTDVARHFGIHAIPEMRVFVNGEPTQVLRGYWSAARLTSRIEPSLRAVKGAVTE